MSNQWTKNADAILKYAKQQNDAGNPFPVWGTCLGIQLLAYLTSNYNSTIISRVHGDDAIILPLTLIGDSYLFKTFTNAQINGVSKGTGVFYFNHNWAVTLDTWNTNPYLKNFWTLTATATTPQNEKFVAGWQAKNYPFFGVQFHPEKNPFEWKVYADRSLEAIEVVQIISNRFVEIARQGKNRFASP